MTCETCGESSPADANWCEACGADLDAAATPPKNPCVSCGAAAVEVTSDGWCQICGTKQPAPEDHVVADHGWFAVVSDRGRAHRTNEDAGAVAPRAGGAALVVCDGVSSTDESQHAAQAAVASIIKVIEAAAPEGADQAIVDAALQAQSKIVDLTPSAAAEPPSCTMVSVVADVNGATATIHFGWLGDSRAYWIANGAAIQLTTDHAQAHSITRWLGADSRDATPETGSLQVELPGTVLLCSDGLWNYAPSLEEIHDLVTSGQVNEDTKTPSALDRAERLVTFANEQGGHDNITVAIAELQPKE